MGMLQGYGEMLYVQYVLHQFPCPEVFPCVSTFLCFCCSFLLFPGCVLELSFSGITPFLELFSIELPSSYCCSASFSSNSRTFFLNCLFLLFYFQLSRVLQHNKQPMQNTDGGLNHKNAETLNVSEAPINTE